MSLRRQVNVLCVIKCQVRERRGLFLFRKITFFFQTVLIPWLNRFWPWVVLAKQFQLCFFTPSQHWVLFSISLCLWDMHVHHVSAPASKCCHIAMNCLLQTLACFFLPPLGHPESTSTGHLNDLCATSLMQTTYNTFTVWTTLCWTVKPQE